jgi:hypothetical protein
MGNKLRPGKLGDAAVVGKPAVFVNSMAEAIEEELNKLMPAERKFATNDNSPETRDRRMLFVAIARGVVDHLSENAEAFTHASGNDLTAKHAIGVDD